MLAIFLSLIFLIIATRWITRPIEQLSTFITSDIKDIIPDNNPALNNKDEIGLLARKFNDLLVDAQKYISRIEKTSIKDPLTNLYNRRHYSNIIDNEIKRCARDKQVINFYYIDIDHFKKYNDNYGHDDGDNALKQVALQLIATTKRASDLSFRFGGEEFLIVAPTSTADGAYQLAERIRLDIERLNIVHAYNGETAQITVSIGLCSVLPGHQISSVEILKEADKQLYNTKRLGRNHVSQRVYGSNN
ncbi:MAG: GGDEF domain-containing protein [Motiliproteus sp.]